MSRQRPVMIRFIAENCGKRRRGRPETPSDVLTALFYLLVTGSESGERLQGGEIPNQESLLEEIEDRFCLGSESVRKNLQSGAPSLLLAKQILLNLATQTLDGSTCQPWTGRFSKADVMQAIEEHNPRNRLHAKPKVAATGMIFNLTPMIPPKKLPTRRKKNN